MFLLSVRATLWGERRAKVTGHKRAIDQSAASPPVGNGATNHKPSLKGKKKKKKKILAGRVEAPLALFANAIPSTRPLHLPGFATAWVRRQPQLASAMRQTRRTTPSPFPTSQPTIFSPCVERQGLPSKFCVPARLL